jgi:hypothetical protein
MEVRNTRKSNEKGMSLKKPLMFPLKTGFLKHLSVPSVLFTVCSNIKEKLMLVTYQSNIAFPASAPCHRSNPKRAWAA